MRALWPRPLQHYNLFTDFPPLILLPPQQFLETLGPFSGRPLPGLMKGAAFLQLASSPEGGEGEQLL